MERSARQKMFSKGQNVNILIILHVHLRWFRTVLGDNHVPQTVHRRYAKRKQPTSFTGNDCLFSQQLFYEYQNEQRHNLNLKPASRMPITQLRLSLVGFCDSTYPNFIKFLLLTCAFQWPCKQVLIGDYFLYPDKGGSSFCHTCYDKAAYIISQAWLWSDA